LVVGVGPSGAAASPHVGLERHPNGPAAVRVSAPPASSEPALSPATAAQVETLLAGGKKLQSEGKHFDAAAQFYKVLQLDPGNAVAERLGYRACGDIALAEMRTTLPAVSAAAPAAASA
jgi:hypothetical protein